MFIPSAPTDDQHWEHVKNELFRLTDAVPAQAWSDSCRVYKQFWPEDRSVEDQNAFLDKLKSSTSSFIDMATGQTQTADSLSVMFMEHIRFTDWIKAVRPDLLVGLRKTEDGQYTEFIDAGWDLDESYRAVAPRVFVSPPPV